jgi:hypothetical protein
MHSVLRKIALGSIVATLLTGVAVAEDQNAKWFVLRDDTTGSCWAGLLLSVNGEYTHSFAQLAGGPYKTKEEALVRARRSPETRRI